ncbi:MAG: SDR family NAD(P)-dependent oxidoreductase [Asticcacaulis sp.]|nr:SDR family NAD(P)-dependent oxidoreductase [Asticcacaulis sp.]
MASSQAKRSAIKPVALVTGASSGIGASAARRLVQAGYIVYGASRSMPDDQSGIVALKLDVTDAASVEACIAEIMRRSGRIDVLVNNAGYGVIGAIEEARSWASCRRRSAATIRRRNTPSRAFPSRSTTNCVISMCGPFWWNRPIRRPALPTTRRRPIRRSTSMPTSGATSTAWRSMRRQAATIRTWSPASSSRSQVQKIRRSAIRPASRPGPWPCFAASCRPLLSTRACASNSDWMPMAPVRSLDLR